MVSEKAGTALSGFNVCWYAMEVAVYDIASANMICAMTLATSAGPMGCPFAGTVTLAVKLADI